MNCPQQNNNRYQPSWEAQLSEFSDAVEVYTNFITPPDFVTNDNHTVVVIDATDQQLDQLAEFCRTANVSYNVYIYCNGMNETDWLNTALSEADAFVVNTVANELSPIKDHIATSTKSWYYGPKNFLGNTRQLTSLENYFQQFETGK